MIFITRKKINNCQYLLLINKILTKSIIILMGNLCIPERIDDDEDNQEIGIYSFKKDVIILLRFRPLQGPTEIKSFISKRIISK